MIRIRAYITKSTNPCAGSMLEDLIVMHKSRPTNTCIAFLDRSSVL